MKAAERAPGTGAAAPATVPGEAGAGELREAEGRTAHHRAVLVRGEQVLERPVERHDQHAPDQPNPYLSDGALWLIEGLGCHLAMLVIAEAYYKQRKYELVHVVTSSALQVDPKIRTPTAIGRPSYRPSPPCQRGVSASLHGGDMPPTLSACRCRRTCSTMRCRPN